MATKKKVVATDAVEIEEEQEAVVAPALRVHIVKKGDTLRTIAREYLGDSSRAAEIRELNKLATDNILMIGRELTIPDR